jgi:hypothetical protein
MLRAEGLAEGEELESNILQASSPPLVSASTSEQAVHRSRPRLRGSDRRFVSGSAFR